MIEVDQTRKVSPFFLDSVRFIIMFIAGVLLTHLILAPFVLGLVQ